MLYERFIAESQNYDIFQDFPKLSSLCIENNTLESTYMQTYLTNISIEQSKKIALNIMFSSDLEFCSSFDTIDQILVRLIAKFKVVRVFNRDKEYDFFS